jgi:hemoglobin-like flavoprotein
MSMIGIAVKGLNDLDKLVPAVQALGVRHAGYGVVDKHYGTVAEALLWTLGEGLGDAFTPEVKSAWTEIYMLLAGVMQEAAAKAPPPAPTPKPAPVAKAEPEPGSGPTAEQIALVQSTFEKVVPIAETAAELFYGKLFELDPSVKPLFKGDMGEQGKKLMSMIGTAVKGLNDLDKLVPAVEALGVRHAGYGVVDKHYGTVAEALLWALEQGLGDTFTAEVKAAWTEIYGLLATVMKGAAAKA